MGYLKSCKFTSSFAKYDTFSLEKCLIDHFKQLGVFTSKSKRLINFVSIFSSYYAIMYMYSMIVLLIIVNFYKLTPTVENVTEKLFFGSINYFKTMVTTRYWK